MTALGTEVNIEIYLVCTKKKMKQKLIHNLPNTLNDIVPFYRSGEYDTYLLKLLDKINEAFDQVADDEDDEFLISL